MPDVVSRSEMMEKPYEPISGGALEFQNAHSLIYIACYLGEIDKKMERIAKALEGLQTSGGSNAATLKMMQQSMAHQR